MRKKKIIRSLSLEEFFDPSKTRREILDEYDRYLREGRGSAEL